MLIFLTFLRSCSQCDCVHYEEDPDNQPSCYCGHSPEEHESLTITDT